MRARKSTWIAVAAVATLSLGACAQGNSSGDDDVDYSSSADLKDVKLSVMGFPDPDEIGQTRWDLAAEAIKPATIKPSEGGFDLQAFLSANSAGNAPDLIYFNRGEYAGTLAALGAIDPLDNCITGEDIPLGDLNQSAVAQVTFQGKKYGVPEFNQVQITQASGSLLADKGLTVDDVNGSDWTKLQNAAAALNAKDGSGKLTTIGYDPKIPEFFPLWVKANGGELISEDGKTASINTPEAVEALEYTMSILDSAGGWPAVKSLRDSADMWGENNQYTTDQLGAMNMEQWYVNVLADVSPDVALATSPFISKTTGEPIAMATGSTWAIPAKAKNKAAACRFIKNMVATDSWMAAAQARVDLYAKDGKPFTGLLTGNDVADQQIRDKFVKDTGSDVWNQAIDSVYTANENLFYMPAIPADQEFRKAWLDGVNRVLAGDMTAQESLDKAQQEGQKALDDGWAKLDKKG